MGVEKISRADVAVHNTKESCWIILDAVVFDCTKFLPDHPGGGDLILKYAGQDATKAFKNAEHSDEAIEMTDEYKVAEIIDSERAFVEPTIKKGDKGKGCCTIS